MAQGVAEYRRGLAPDAQRPWRGRLTALYDALRLVAVWTVQGKKDQRSVLLRALRDYFDGRFGRAKNLG